MALAREGKKGENKTSSFTVNQKKKRVLELEYERILKLDAFLNLLCHSFQPKEREREREREGEKMLTTPCHARVIRT